ASAPHEAPPARPPEALSDMRIGVVGTGYVGLPLAVAFAEAGHDVHGVDVNAQRVEDLQRGISHIGDLASQRLKAAAEHLSFGTRVDGLAEAEAIIVCVPTPLTRNREPDLSALVAAAQAIAGV